ncbi:hypothetical protein [Alienimonas sp. DA493]|uniref:hypothetical protein n=1 Tax=Alienimonas sp. DA493 TaxID=3373605 RepID=UPI0037546912
MIGARTAVDAEGPVIRVFARPFCVWGLVLFGGIGLFIVGGAAMSELGLGDARVDAGFWWFGAPIGTVALLAGALGLSELREPSAAVAIRPDRFVLRQPLLVWTKGRTVRTADVVQLWAVGTGDRKALGEDGGPDRLCVRLRSGRVIRYEAMNLAISGVELERLIRETTGLDAPGRPAGQTRSTAVRWLRQAVGADPGGPVAAPGEGA